MSDLNTHLHYRDLPAFFFSDVEPVAVSDVKIVALNTALANSLSLDETWLRSDEGLSILSGQSAIGGVPSLAMAYGGHQFGHWSGLLGDGRARLVGDLPNKDRAGTLYELHLTGSGATPYSRRGDGKATLGSAIREYVVSEAMAALGVPSTRALSIITTGETVIRNGAEPGAILCRTARSHIRVGTFQLAAASGEGENVKALADFTIDRLYPEAPNSGHDRYRHFLRAVVARQADLVAKWMGLGFIHGVMNTDNACISGETIDYGPCAFMDEFHPGKTFSSIDRNGRYAWNKQAEMAHWNLTRLAESLLPLLGDSEDTQIKAAEEDLNSFVAKFETALNQIMATKLGVEQAELEKDGFLNETFKTMTIGKVDFTLFFRNLTLVAAGKPDSKMLELFADQELGHEWLTRWKTAAKLENVMDAVRLKTMQASNPIIIPRNHRVEQAIADANQGNLKTFETLMDAVSQPFTDRPEFANFETPPLAEEIVHQTFCGT